MNLSVSNFLSAIKNVVTGGGRLTDGSPNHDAGFAKRAEGISLATLKPTGVIPVASTAVVLSNMGDGSSDNTLVAIGDTSSTNQSDNIELNFDKMGDEVNLLVLEIAAIKNFLAGTADETNARVLKVEEAIDDIGHIVWTVPRDYDEATDILTLRILASMITVSTDDDVVLDAEVYVKRAGVALSSDKGPTVSATILSATEQWIEFDLKGYSLLRDDVVIIQIITTGLNDTDGEEIQLHDLELTYRSCLVSYARGNDAEGNSLR